MPTNSCTGPRLYRISQRKHALSRQAAGDTKYQWAFKFKGKNSHFKFSLQHFALLSDRAE